MPLRYKDFGDGLQNGASCLGGSRLYSKIEAEGTGHSVTWEMEEASEAPCLGTYEPCCRLRSICFLGLHAYFLNIVISFTNNKKPLHLHRYQWFTKRFSGPPCIWRSQPWKVDGATLTHSPLCG